MGRVKCNLSLAVMELREVFVPLDTFFIHLIQHVRIKVTWWPTLYSPQHYGYDGTTWPTDIASELDHCCWHEQVHLFVSERQWSSSASISLVQCNKCADASTYRHQRVHEFPLPQWRYVCGWSQHVHLHVYISLHGDVLWIR